MPYVPLAIPKGRRYVDLEAQPAHLGRPSAPLPMPQPARVPIVKRTH